jgi:hypothetical protein
MKYLLAITFIFGLFSCNRGPLRLHVDEDPVESNEQAANQDDEQNPEVIFDVVNEAVFKPRCLKCHQDSEPILITEQDYLIQIQQVKNEVLIRRTMPRRATLTESEYKLVKAWVDDVLN